LGSASVPPDAAFITNDIVLGNLGGTLFGGNYDGNISGAGMLTLTEYRNYVRGTNNTYTGGTLVPGVGAGNQQKIAANSSLGPSGTVTVWNAGADWGNSRAGLILEGDGNLTVAHSLMLNSFNSFAMFKSANPVVGSIEGNGTISIGTETVASTLRVGGNNRSTDYFGLISDADFFSATRTGLDLGKLVKEGTGTLTLWGESWYRGGTIISNGTLCVNNWMNPAGGGLVVTPGATLDGIGNVGIVSNRGGTVKGNLYMRQLVMAAGSTNAVTLNGTNAASQYGQFNVSEGVTLTDSVLDLKLGFAPAVGQSFTIINNAGTLNGTFTCGSGIPATYGGRTYFFRVNYDGGDVVLTRLVTGTVMTIR
jgi:autotransporter-associated beta strand protein